MNSYMVNYIYEKMYLNLICTFVHEDCRIYVSVTMENNVFIFYMDVCACTININIININIINMGVVFGQLPASRYPPINECLQ